MKYKLIYVRAQADPKVIPANLLVEINRYIEAYKKISELKIGDMFLYKGAWYDVESISDNGDSPYTPDEQKRINKLMSGANDAVEEFGEDELERWSRNRHTL